MQVMVQEGLEALLSFRSSTDLEMVVFVTSSDSRGPCATPGLRGWDWQGPVRALGMWHG